MKPVKILGLSDFGMPSGFGRIANEVFSRLQQRGHQVMGASIYWDGCKPHGLPFWVFPLAGRDIWAYFSSLVIEHKPDLVVVIQDFPYAHTFYNGTRSDFSKFKWMFVTPIDGVPIYKPWLDLVDQADSAMVISEFGVEAMRQAGKKVHLLRPSINRKEFYPLGAEEKKELRTKAGLPEDAFVVGTMAMNQGRKAFEFMVPGFLEFARDKSNAYYLLDCDKVGQGGWDVKLMLAEQIGFNPKNLLFKEDLINKGLTNLNERYNLLDAHMVLSHREGFGLPLVESQACKVATLAMDWCSGTEICGNGKGILIPKVETKYPRYGTWGGAIDYDPDTEELVKALNLLYNSVVERQTLGERGYQAAISHTWDDAADQFEQAMEIAMARPPHVKPVNQIPVRPPVNNQIAGLNPEPPIVLEQPEQVRTEAPLVVNEVTESMP